MGGKPTLREAAGSFVKELGNPLFALFLFVAVTALIFADRRSKFVSAWALAAFCGCIGYMSIIGRTTRWVTAGMLGAGVLAIAWTFGLRAEISKKKGKTGLILVSVASAAAFFACNGSSVGFYNAAFRTDMLGIYEALGADDGTLYLMDIETQPEMHRVVPVLASMDYGLYGNIYTLGGWDTESPAKNSILRRYGVEGSPFRALVERENILLCDTKNYMSKRTYIREHYDSAANMSLFDVIDGYYIFAFTGEITAEGRAAGYLLEEAAIEANAMAPGFTYIGAKVTGDNCGAETVYINVYENGFKNSYRAKLTEFEEGFAATMAAPEGELFYNDVEIEVIIKTADGFFAAGDRLKPVVTG